MSEKQQWMRISTTEFQRLNAELATLRKQVEAAKPLADLAEGYRESMMDREWDDTMAAVGRMLVKRIDAFRATQEQEVRGE